METRRDPLPPIPPASLAAALREPIEQRGREVTDAVNRAPTGPGTNHRAEPARDPLAEFRRTRYQTALQSLDALPDVAEATRTVRVRELACRLNQAAANLARAAQGVRRGAFLRQVVEAEGQTVLKVQPSGALILAWTAAACRIPSPGVPPAGGPAPGPPPRRSRRSVTWRPAPVPS